MPATRRKRLAAAAVLAAVMVAVFVVRTHDRRMPDAYPEIQSALMERGAVDAAFSGIGSISADPGIRIGLINHHLLAPHLIAGVLARMATDEPVTVILVSPDHFDRGPTWATTAVARWTTPFGTLEPAADAVAVLASSGSAVRPAVLAREHGITNITMFIGRAMPRARVAPLAIKTGAPDEVVTRLAQAVAGLPGRVLVIGSFDFTHESTAAQARANDDRSVGVLERGNPDGVPAVNVDSRAGVRFLLDYAARIGVHFTLMDRSDSAAVLGQPNRTDVTSYITGVWAR